VFSFTYTAASFRLFDEDGNGELDRQEVERMLILVMKSMVLFPLSSPSPKSSC
jgi:hypothetical protein